MRFPVSTSLACASGWCAVALLLGLPGWLHAGLYYSGERQAELPSQWRGFLLDQRLLRGIAVKPSASVPASPARVRYQQEAERLTRLAAERALSADEAADLGALLVRLGEPARALSVLRTAQNQHPDHFHLAANLGCAAHLDGDLDQAAAFLQRAVTLAPGPLRPAEQLHLKVVRLRGRPGADPQALDDLFGIRYVGPDGTYQPGQLAPEQRKALPAEALALTQQLALWLPADARLLWQLGELANVHGDPTTAAALMDGCVTEFGLRSEDLRRHRQLVRAAADKLKTEGPASRMHEQHAVQATLRSARPLLSRVDLAPLPPVDPRGVNALPWAVISETAVDRRYRPTFAPYLKELDGKLVRLTGFLQPLGEDLEAGAFLLIEYPVGCWFCETPAMANILLIELPRDKTFTYTRDAVRVEGRLSLNATDPENFFYTLRDAKVTTGE